MESEQMPDSEPTMATDIALDDWAAGKSRSLGRRIEALSAFYKRCQREGLGRATAEEFEARFTAFLTQPVGG